MGEKRNLRYMKAHVWMMFAWVLLCFLGNAVDELNRFIYGRDPLGIVVTELIIRYCILFGLPLVFVVGWLFKGLAVTSKAMNKKLYGSKYATMILVWGVIVYLISSGKKEALIDIIDNPLLKSLSAFFTIPLALFASALSYRREACLNRDSKIASTCLIVAAIFCGLLVFWLGGKEPNDYNMLGFLRFFRACALYFTPIMMIITAIGYNRGQGNVMFLPKKEDLQREDKGIVANFFDPSNQNEWKTLGTLVSVGWVSALYYATFADFKIGRWYSHQFQLWNAETIITLLFMFVMPLFVIWANISPGRAEADVCTTDEGKDNIEVNATKEEVTMTSSKETITPAKGEKDTKKLWSLCAGIIAIIMISVGIFNSLSASSGNNNVESNIAQNNSGEDMSENTDVTTQLSDINAFGMKGPVKSVEDYALLNAKMSFDEEGRLTAIDNYRIEYNNTTGTVVGGADVRRDNQGRILWVGKAGECSGEIGYHFEYNDKGLAKWWHDEGDCTEMTVYEVQEYDDTKRPTSVKSTSTSKEEKTVADIEYSFERSDEWGNWISCEQTIDFTTTIIDPDDGSEHFGDSRVSTNKWKRIIRYYN